MGSVYGVVKNWLTEAELPTIIPLKEAELPTIIPLKEAELPTIMPFHVTFRDILRCFDFKVTWL